MTTTFETVPQYTTSFSLEAIQETVNTIDFNTTTTATATTMIQSFVNTIKNKTIMFDKMSESHTDESQRETVEYICVFLLNSSSPNDLVLSMDSNLQENTILFSEFKDIFISSENQAFGLKTINIDSIIDHFIYITYRTTSHIIGILIKTFPINIFVPPVESILSSGIRAVAEENARLIETPKHSYSNLFKNSY